MRILFETSEWPVRTLIGLKQNPQVFLKVLVTLIGPSNI